MEQASSERPGSLEEMIVEKVDNSSFAVHLRQDLEGVGRVENDLLLEGRLKELPQPRDATRRSRSDRLAVRVEDVGEQPAIAAENLVEAARRQFQALGRKVRPAVAEPVEDIVVVETLQVF